MNSVESIAANRLYHLEYQAAPYFLLAETLAGTGAAGAGVIEFDAGVAPEVWEAYQLYRAENAVEEAFQWWQECNDAFDECIELGDLSSYDTAKWFLDDAEVALNDAVARLVSLGGGLK